MHFLVFYTVYPSSHMFPPQTSKISQQLCPGTIHGTGLLVALLRLLRCDVLGMLHLVSRPCEFISVPEIQKTCPKKQKAEILIFIYINKDHIQKLLTISSKSSNQLRGTPKTTTGPTIPPSSAAPVHFFPPWAAALATPLVRFCTPPAHVLEHLRITKNEFGT